MTLIYIRSGNETFSASLSELDLAVIMLGVLCPPADTGVHIPVNLVEGLDGTLVIFSSFPEGCSKVSLMYTVAALLFSFRPFL